MSKKLPKDRYFYIKDVECTTTISYTTRKELLGLLDNIINNRYDTFEFMEDDGACFHIIYKDGTDDIVNMFYDGHKIKRINIASIVYTDATENLVYGNFEVSECGSVSASLTEKIDNTNVVEVDREYKFEPLEIADAEKDIDYTLMSDNDLHDVVLSQLDYINRDLMETCVYNDLNGNGKYVHVSDNDFMDVTPALAEYNRRFGTTEIFCLIYRHFESRKTHVEYDSFDDTMYIVEVIPYDDDGNIIEYGYYVGDYYVRYSGVTENIEIVEVNENEPETTNETKNEKEVKKAMEKTNREFKVNNTTYSVVNNPNYNKEFAFEQSSMKYYAMKLLTTDNTTKSWVKTGITGNTIDKVKEKVKEWEDFMKYVDNYDSTKTAEIVEPVEPVEPVKDTNNLKLSDDAITHIRNAYNWIIGGLINGLCDNKPDTLEYKECFNMLHGGEKLVIYIYNECLENGFDVGWCGLGQAPAEIKKYDGWLIKNHIRNMLVLDNIFSLPTDNDTILNEIHNIPAKKLDSILDLIEQCNSCMEKSMLIDYVSFETGVSYDAIKEIYNEYIKETFLDDTTFDSVIDEIYNTAFSDDIIPF